MKPQPYLSDKILRIPSFNIFKWTNKGVIMSIPNQPSINLDDLLTTDALDILEHISETDIPDQVIIDIKEVKQYLLDKSIT